MARPVIAHIPRRLSGEAWGGTERVLESSLPWQKKAGADPFVATSMALAPKAEESLHGMAVRRFPYSYPEWPLSEERRQRYDNKGGNLVSFALAKHLHKTPDLRVLHLHTGNRLAAQCLRVARKRGIPAVITLHGGHFVIPTEERSHLATNDLGRKGFEWGKILSAMWGTRQLLESVDAVICVGQDEYAAASQALPQQRVLHVPGGYDPTAANQANATRGHQLLGTDAAKPLVVCVARLDQQKDQRTLVEAWRPLANQCQLALVGPETSPGYADECLAAADSAPLIIAGAHASADVPDILAAATIAVLPSRHEPFGLAILEAWGVGCPVIGSDTGGPGWLLGDEHGGTTFPVGSVDALREKLLFFLQHPDQIEQRGKNGQERALSTFTWEQRAKTVWNLYRACGADLPDWNPVCD